LRRGAFAVPQRTGLRRLTLGGTLECRNEIEDYVTPSAQVPAFFASHSEACVREDVTAIAAHYAGR